MPQPLRPKLTFANKDLPLPSRLTAMAIAATLVVGLGAAGCGSSSKKSSSSKSATAITKPEFLTKANAICTKGNKQSDAAGAKLGQNPSQAQIVAVVKGADVPSIQAQIDGIRALGAPSADRATVTNLLNLAQADLNKVKSKPALLFGKIDPFADFAKIAHPYGLKACDQSR